MTLNAKFLIGSIPYMPIASQKSESALMDKWQAMVQVMFEAQLHALVPYGFEGSAQGIKDFTMQLNDIMHSHPRGTELVDLGESGALGNGCFRLRSAECLLSSLLLLLSYIFGLNHPLTDHRCSIRHYPLEDPRSHYL